MPDFTAAIGLLRKPIEDLYGMASGEVREQLAKLRAVSKVKKIHTRLWQSQRVKTIWHTSKPLSLSSFFHPVSVSRPTDHGNSEIRINSLDDLPDLHNIIFGTVGQGKSILLRFLLGREIKSGSRIPLFIELRHVENGKFFDYIFAEFSKLLDVTVDQKLFHFFADHGKISFFLDGFDEVEPGNVARLMKDIDELSAAYPFCRIALTSRPDSECKHLTNFHSVNIASLKHDELVAFYRRLTRDIGFSNSLIAAIKTSPTQIRELLITPLLATLLAISYGAAQKIPLDFSEFYDDLFEILLTRHDGAKLGWRRHRRTKLNDREIQQVFEAFCFASRKRQLTLLDREAAYQISKDSIDKVKVVADPDHFLGDITSITCLLVVEGKKSSFVHSSVQEFFAARFVKSSPEPVAANFYTKLLQKRKWYLWRQELFFLQQIDVYRSRKYFLIPDLQSAVDFLTGGSGTVTSAGVATYLSNLSVVRKKVTVDGKIIDRFYVNKRHVDAGYYLESLDGRVFGKLFSVGAAGHGLNAWNVGFLNNPSVNERGYSQIAADRGSDFSSELGEFLKNSISNYISQLQSMKDSVKKDESITDFVDLDEV
jgi:hypothetical protein